MNKKGYEKKLSNFIAASREGCVRHSLNVYSMYVTCVYVHIHTYTHTSIHVRNMRTNKNVHNALITHNI